MIARQDVADAPRRTTNAPFVVVCVSVIVGALVSVLLLNTTMAEGAYEARDLLIETADLLERRADLLLELDAYAAPQNLLESAEALGMVPAEAVGYISLEDGTVDGVGGEG